MPQQENLGSFIKENKKLLSEYIETRIEIIRLQGIKASSKAIANLVWVLISLFLVSVVFIFAGLVLGFWLSELTGSMVKGFGYTTLIMIVLVIILALLREQLFINPVLKKILNKMNEETASADEDNL